MYDEENFNQQLQSQSPYRPHLRRVLYSPNRGFDEQVAKQGRESVSCKKCHFDLFCCQPVISIKEMHVIDIFVFLREGYCMRKNNSGYM